MQRWLSQSFWARRQGARYSGQDRRVVNGRLCRPGQLGCSRQLVLWFGRAAETGEVYMGKHKRHERTPSSSEDGVLGVVNHANLMRGSLQGFCRCRVRRRCFPVRCLGAVSVQKVIPRETTRGVRRTKRGRRTNTRRCFNAAGPHGRLVAATNKPSPVLLQHKKHKKHSGKDKERDKEHKRLVKEAKKFLKKREMRRRRRRLHATLACPAQARCGLSRPAPAAACRAQVGRPGRVRRSRQ